MDRVKPKDRLISSRMRWVVILSATVLALVVGLLIANHVIGIYHFEESYPAADGTIVTDRYTVKKQNGVYALFDCNGNQMEQNQDGKYIAAGSGNQYTIDPESGDWKLYAEVAYDASVGESVGGRRVMMFPQILQKDLAKVSVKNATGEYEVYRDENGTVRFSGVESDHVVCNTQNFAAFAVGAGYPVTLNKLDFSSAGVQKKQDGSVDYASYGLEERYGEDGSLLSTPDTYTVSARDASQEGYTPDPARTYTVVIGDKTLTGNGYYVRLEGRDAIYVMSASTLESTVKNSVENLVAAYAVIPSTVSSYLMVRDFVLARMTLTNDLEATDLWPIVRFDYQDQNARINTLYEMRPYVCKTELMEGYEINNDNASTVLERLHELESPTCVKLGLGEGEQRADTLAEYGIVGEVFYLSYHPLLTDSDGSYGYSEEDFNLLLISSQKTEAGTYYVASLYFDMILEVDQYYLPFLEWEEKDWYFSYPVSENIAYVQTLSVESGDEFYQFDLDNSLSYAYYIDEDGTYRFPSVSGGRVALLSNGTYVYIPNEGGRYTLYALDFDNEKKYYDKDGNALLTPEINSNYLQVSSPQAGGALNYTVLKKMITDLNEERYRTLTELDNFRYLWKRFLYFTVEGDVDRVSFEKMTGRSVEDYLAMRVEADDADVTIRYITADHAASCLINNYVYRNESGKTVKLFTENNQKEVILRFYCYSGQKALMTLELISEYDKDGNPVEHPEKQVARFTVRNDYLFSLIENAGRVVIGELVEDVQ